MKTLSRAEYARHAGVNRATVTRWIQNGRIQSEPDGSIDPDKADRQREASESPMPHHQARKAQIDAQKAAQAATDATAPATPAATPAPALQEEMEDIGRALKRETWRLQKAKAETANLQLDQAAGLLVDRAEVDFVLADFGNTLRGLLESLPDRYTGTIAALRGDAGQIHKALEDASREILTEIADHMHRKMENINANL